MSWEVYLRNNGNVAVGGIFYNVFHFLLSIEASVRFTIEGVPLFVYHSLATSASYHSKFGVFFRFKTPTLIIGEMPVEFIDIVES